MALQGPATTYNPDDPQYSGARHYQNDMLAVWQGIATLRAQVGTSSAPVAAAQIPYRSGTNSGGGGSGGTSSSGSIGIAFTTAAASILAVDPTTPQPTGTFTFDLDTQAENTLLAGPVSGADAAPMFRALDASDIPSLPYLPTITAATETPSGTIDGVNQTFTVTNAIVPWAVVTILYAGIPQAIGYTVSGNTITFGIAPPALTVLTLTYFF